MRLKAGLIASLSTTLVLAAVPASSVAQESAPPKTVTALATASVAVARPVHLSNATIRAAVATARTNAGPAAVANVRAEAQRLASAAGLTLGALQSVAEQAGFPFGPFGGLVDGTFGPNKYCGTIRTPVFKRDKHGHNVFQHRFHSHVGCRVPPSVAVSVSATFAAS